MENYIIGALILVLLIREFLNKRAKQSLFDEVARLHREALDRAMADLRADSAKAKEDYENAKKQNSIKRPIDN